MEEKQRKIEQTQPSEAREMKRDTEAEIHVDQKEASRQDVSETTVPVVQQPSVVSVEPEPASIDSVKSQRLQEVESILSDGLQDLYWSLTPPDQQKFREKGEEVARKIDGLLNQATLRIAKVIDFIKEWLRTIPHINRFFLEQEAKIKADKVRALHETSQKK